MAVLGTIGFAICFNVGSKRMYGMALGGFISWTLYLLFLHRTNNLFLASFLSSLMTAIYSEIMARVAKTPATIFLIPSVIPLLPGSSFYYAMAGALNINRTEFQAYGTEMVLMVLGITFGIVIGTFVLNQIFLVKNIRKEQSK